LFTSSKVKRIRRTNYTGGLRAALIFWANRCVTLVIVLAGVEVTKADAGSIAALGGTWFAVGSSLFEVITIKGDFLWN
jgi:hypothetical protein